MVGLGTLTSALGLRRRSKRLHGALCVSPAEGRCIAKLVDLAFEVDDMRTLEWGRPVLEVNERIVMRNLADRVGGVS